MNWTTIAETPLETPHKDKRHGFTVRYSDPVLVYFPDCPFGKIYRVAVLEVWENGAITWSERGTHLNPSKIKYAKINPPK